MEKSIVNFIAEAEERAADLKAQAQLSAGSILFEAEERAQKIAKDSGVALARRSEETLKNAEETARREYENALLKSRREAKEYADALLEHTQIYVADIVGRIVK